MPLVTIEVSDSVHAFVRRRADFEGVSVEQAASNILAALFKSERFLNAITGLGDPALSQEVTESETGQ